MPRKARPARRSGGSPAARAGAPRAADRERGIEAERLRRLPAYVFAELERLKAEQRARGADLIDLGMGNPDLPVPGSVLEAMQRALAAENNHRYPEFRGIAPFREAAAAWCLRRYGVTLDPETEVVPLLGSKEGLVHLALSVLDRGDVTLLPQPAYPAHFRGTLLAGGIPYAIPQRPASEIFGAGAGDDTGADPVPDLEAIPAAVLRKARLLILSYPTNPTAFCAPPGLFPQALDFARRHRLILVHDYAYAEVFFEGTRPPCLLALPGAKEVAVEFHTFSKTFSMAGWRLAFAAGNRDILAALMKFKSNCDYGVFQAAQHAGVAALRLGEEYLAEMRLAYRRRRDLFVAGLERLGLRLPPPRATMYLWVPAPPGMDGAGLARILLERASVVVAPGSAFGEGGGRFARLALVDGEDRLREALRRMEAAGITWGA